MGYSNTYAPAYYSSLQDSITSICKSILPFSLKKRRLTAAEQKLSKQQSDNLKWQQNCFHQILNLIGLHKEGLLPDSEVSAFRIHLLDTLIASKGPHNHKEQPQILRDKLLFLQELVYAKCISAEEYHASKRPLLQRLAVQGAELEARDVIVGERKESEMQVEDEEEWSVIDLKDDQSLINKDYSRSNNRSKSAVKHIKDAASVFGLEKLGKNRHQKKSIFDQFPVDNGSISISNKENDPIDENPFWNDSNIIETESETQSILMSASESNYNGLGKEKKTGFQFRGLFQSDKSEEKDKDSKFTKMQWGFDGFKRWNVEVETTSMPLTERSSNNNMQGPQDINKQIKRNGSSSGFYIDKVVGDNIRKELSRIQTQLSTTNPNFHFSNDEMDVISTKLPVDKSDLNHYFPKSWCERYGDVVLDVVKKEFKDHVGEMENMRNATWERRRTSSKRWTTSTFEDDENSHPNRVAPANPS